MERGSRGGGRVRTNLTESHEMRRNEEKLSTYFIPSMKTSPHLVGSDEMRRNGENLSVLELEYHFRDCSYITKKFYVLNKYII